jgi:hypothetical protein
MSFKGVIESLHGQNLFLANADVEIYFEKGDLKLFPGGKRVALERLAEALKSTTRRVTRVHSPVDLAPLLLSNPDHCCQFLTQFVWTKCKRVFENEGENFSQLLATCSNMHTFQIPLNCEFDFIIPKCLVHMRSFAAMTSWPLRPEFLERWAPTLETLGARVHTPFLLKSLPHMHQLRKLHLYLEYGPREMLSLIDLLLQMPLLTLFSLDYADTRTFVDRESFINHKVFFAFETNDEPTIIKAIRSATMAQLTATDGDMYENTLLHIAAERGVGKHIWELLFQHAQGNLRLSSKNYMEDTPLDVARDKALVEELVLTGADEHVLVKSASKRFKINYFY